MKTIGIIGGMGPLATADLFRKIILCTAAQADQEHIPILIDNNTAIPDRTAAIRGEGPSPVPELLRSARRLMKGGADVLIMGCNTAHYFLPAMLPQLTVPFLSMIDATAQHCAAQGFSCVGLLASAGTCASGIYQKALARYGIRLVEPDLQQQQVLQDVIYYGVKAGDASYDVQAFRQVLQDMRCAGAGQFILGCTELPIAVTRYGVEESFIDATEVLAAAAVSFAGARCAAPLDRKPAA